MNFSAFYGWGVIVLALLGYGTAYFSKGADRRKLLAVFGYGLLSALTWTFLAKQYNPHFTLHYTIWIVPGLACLLLLLVQNFTQKQKEGSINDAENHASANFIQKIWTQLKQPLKWVFLLGLGAYFMVNSLSWFGILAFPSHSPQQAFFTELTAPQVRNDYDEVARLVELLQSRGSQNEAIYVVDASYRMNDDTIRNADKTISPYSQRLNVLPVPSVDSRDYYPLEGLLKAQYVVVSKPFQSHTPLSETGVAYSAFEMFAAQWGLANDFERLPVEYNLIENVKTHVYRRVKATDLETALKTLTKIDQIVGERPGHQPDWILLAGVASSSVVWDNPPSGFLSMDLSAGQTSTFAWLGRPEIGLSFQARISISKPECARLVSFQLLSARPTGEWSESSLKTQSTAENVSIAVGDLPDASRYLMIAVRFEPNAEPGCQAIAMALNQPIFSRP